MKSRTFIDRLTQGLQRNLAVGFVVLALLVAAAVFGTSRLTINTNQIDLLPADMIAVKEAKRISEMTGGIGFLMLALKGNDEQHLKDVADDLTALLLKMPEVRRVRTKLDISWVRDRIGLYVQTDDLAEVRKRVEAKIKDVVRRNNPFHITLRETKPVKLELSDIVDKYRTVGKKGIADDYNITRDRKMLLLLIKPKGASTDLEFTRMLVDKVEALIARYNKDNKREAILKQGYRTLQPGATITYGYTGGYKLNLDDSDSIIQSLKPTSAISISGIFLLLLIFLRRIVLVLSLLTSLVLGVILTFGFCYLSVGELNSITAILAGILMGQGIDFGIQFIYRVREEYTRTRDFTRSIGQALHRLGVAAITTACTTACAFFALTISDFKGFRDFGLVAGGGTFLIAGSMLLVTAMLLMAVNRFWPGYTDKLLQQPQKRQKALAAAAQKGRVPAVQALIWTGLLITAVLLGAAVGGHPSINDSLPKKMTEGVQFDYDSRALMVKDRPSIILQQEIKERFEISADPAAVYTPTLEEAKKLYMSMRPRGLKTKYGLPDPERFSTVDAVISLFLFIPDLAQQKANVKILQQMKKDFEPIKPSMLKDKKHQEYFKKYQHLLDAKPFTLEDIPDRYVAQFRNVPESKEKGFLTFIYPKVALWDSRDLLAFSNQVSELKVGETTYHATGMAIIFARLATIVLSDGKVFTALASVAIIFILLFSLRSVVATLVTLLPLVIGVIWMLGMMALLGQRMNFMNIVIFPVVLGYGMGTGIYIFHRFRESGSARIAVSQTGRAVLASCVTTLVGWSSLLTANHLGLESMGVLASLGIGCVLITSLTLLPALMQLLQPWFARRGVIAKQEEDSAKAPE